MKKTRPITKRELEVLGKALSFVMLQTTDELTKLPGFKRFLNGSSSILRIGIFQLTREDPVTHLYSLNIPSLKRGEQKDIQIGATLLTVRGAVKIQFFASPS